MKCIGPSSVHKDEIKPDINFIYRLELPIDVLKKTYIFLRELGESGMFTFRDLVAKTQIGNDVYAKRLIKFSLDSGIISPAHRKCSVCGFEENSLSGSFCEKCRAPLTNRFSDLVFEVVGEIPRTAREEKYEREKIKEIE